MEQNKRKSSNINRLLSARIKPGGTYTNDEIKRVLTFIQEKLHLGHKLKITDFYEVEESIKKIEGKTTRGKKIIRFLPQA
jgi:hypothetical protein